jgi:hypothetical protein
MEKISLGRLLSRDCGADPVVEGRLVRFTDGWRRAAWLGTSTALGVVVLVQAALATNTVRVNTVSAAPGQTAVMVTLYASLKPPATLLSVDITFDSALCARLENQTIQKAGRTLVETLEGGIRCPDTGKVSIVLLDPNLAGNVATPPCTCRGDANKDGFVNLFDFGAIKQNAGLDANPNTAMGDGNCDNFVNLFDFGATKQNAGLDCLQTTPLNQEIATWKFDVRAGASSGSFPLSVTVNEASNGPLKICAEGTVPGTGSCAAPIQTTGGSLTIGP